jgi:hypothetical protein
MAQKVRPNVASCCCLQVNPLGKEIGRSTLTWNRKREPAGSADTYPLGSPFSSISLPDSSPRVPYSWNLVTKQKGSKIRQVASPNHPGMSPRRLDFGRTDSLRFQPVPKLTIHINEAILCAASDPEQA